MSTSKTKFRRDLFEIDNARNLTRDELVATFVPTTTFWRLLSAKNHVVLGSRGSGKTALAKMLSHDHLSRLKHERARAAIESKSFIGIYVPTRLEWVGGLKNKPWLTDAEAEHFFQWRLNIATCLAFLITLRSCLDTYVKDPGERARVESVLAGEIAKSWSNNEHTFDTVRSLQNYVEDIEHYKQQQLARERAYGRLLEGETPVGIYFGTELFIPIRRAISLTARVLDLPDDCTWLLCIDEAEFLNPLHQRILNSHLRAYSGNLIFKITTMPYFHYTLETNTDVSLNVGHDFEYVYIDQDPILWKSNSAGGEGQMFAGTLFNKRAEVSGSKYWKVSLSKLLGNSELLDRKKDDWSANSKNITLLRTYASKETILRAEKLFEDKSSLMDQLVRKIQPALMLRHAVSSLKGRQELDIYSGESMMIRCSDANPRRLIRIFNSILLEAKLKKYEQSGFVRVAQVPKKSQTRILLSFSNSTLTRIQSEPLRGPELYAFMSAIGNYMHATMYEIPLTTDQISSIIIDPSIPDEQWKLVKRAVGLGLLYPNTNANNPDQMPEKTGIFHLAYVLAPHFHLVPRRGKARRLRTLLRVMAPANFGQLEMVQGDFDFLDQSEIDHDSSSN